MGKAGKTKDKVEDRLFERAVVVCERVVCERVGCARFDLRNNGCVCVCKSSVRQRCVCDSGV